MAKDTKNDLRQLVIYSVYVRNHSPEGTFRALADDLDRIRALGADVIWLMPIHPIGVQGKKGSLGCPYANRDYRTVNPEYGSMADFERLVQEIHARGMKCMIDVVYNHTSPDSTLVREHPEFFYRRPDGRLGNRVGDWSDVVDLDYGNPGLWEYQIRSLARWAELVDGFRCDVASFVPVEFWLRAREAVAQVNPGCIWLAETVHSRFGQTSRRNGLYCANDYEVFSAFDMEYEYDIRETFERFLRGEATLSHYLDMLFYQECIYPDNYNKLRFLENHDLPRIASVVKDECSLVNHTALLYFLKGATLLYAGQEFCCRHTPSLFDRDVFPRDTGKDITPLLQRLAVVKKTVLSPEDSFLPPQADDARHIAILTREDGRTRKTGVFSLRGEAAAVAVELPDGEYTNHLDGSAVTVTGGKLFCSGRPVILSSAM